MAKSPIELRDLEDKVDEFLATDPDRSIQAEDALRPELTGMVFFDEPLFGCADADDELFAAMRSNEAVYGRFLRLPSEWLPGAKRVVSIFFPLSQSIRDDNRKDPVTPSDGWLHARIEGHAFLCKTIRMLIAYLQECGYQAVAPTLSDDFSVLRNRKDIEPGWPPFESNWSERHVAYVAGLGTFSASKHLITEKGVCGRFGSIITDAELVVTPRPYSDPFEYCIGCGACAKRCPVDAITPVKGERTPQALSACKDNRICSAYLDRIKEQHYPRYGCGKCQLSVPCESGIPRRRQR